MRFLRLGIELLVTIGGSAVVWHWFGTQQYLACGLVMTLIIAGLVVSTHFPRRRPTSYDPLIEDHATPLMWRVGLILLWGSMIFAAWPVLPLVLAWRRASDRVDGDQPQGIERP